MEKAPIILLGIVIIATLSYGAFAYMARHADTMASNMECEGHCISVSSRSMEAYLLVAVVFLLTLTAFSVVHASLHPTGYNPIRELSVDPPFRNIITSTILLE